jgi:hypothetical protein
VVMIDFMGFLVLPIGWGKVVSHRGAAVRATNIGIPAPRSPQEMVNFR